MNFIPIGAFGFGAQATSAVPISYAKSRLARSTQTTYILHSKGGCMPGQPELFNATPCSNPGLNAALNENQINRAFKKTNLAKENAPIGAKYGKDSQDSFTYDEYGPNDDEALGIAIKASYRQIFGNLHPMESERPIDLERRLRNGDIPIREFIRQLAKSSFYRTHFFESVNQQRCIELTFKHLLGRPPINQAEVIQKIEILWELGFGSHIDSLIDSDEYQQIFGLNIVPYQRCWNSPCGIRTSSFTNTAKLTRSFATSDNAIHGRKASPEEGGGISQLVNSLGTNHPEEIKVPSHVSFVLSVPR